MRRVSLHHDELAIAELALGVLEGAEEARVRALVENDPVAAALHLEWQAHWLRLIDAIEPVAVPETLWSDVSQRIGADDHTRPAAAGETDESKSDGAPDNVLDFSAPSPAPAKRRFAGENAAVRPASARPWRWFSLAAGVSMVVVLLAYLGPEHWPDREGASPTPTETADETTSDEAGERIALGERQDESAGSADERAGTEADGTADTESGDADAGAEASGTTDTESSDADAGAEAAGTADTEDGDTDAGAADTGEREVDTPLVDDPRFVAGLQAPGTGARLGWTIEIDREGALRLEALATDTIAEGRVLQFWTLASHDEAPRSLGLVAPGASVTIDAEQVGAVESGQLFELTLEPAGGSPTGQPTGEIIYIGRLLKI